MAPRRSTTYGPGTDTCAEAAAGRRTAIVSATAAPVRGTAFPPALLPALRFPPFSPVLAHPHRHRSARGGGHRAAAAPPSASHPAIRCLRLTSAAKQLGELAPDRRFFLAELLEPR